MNDFCDLASDNSKSNETIIADKDEIDDILKKYGSGDLMPFRTNNPKPSELTNNSDKDLNCGNSNFPRTSEKKRLDNIYSLDDFSDEEFNYEPLENRLKISYNKTNSNTFQANSSWQDKFTAEDFCEDSNDIDTVLNRISQLESEQFKDRPQLEVSKEIESLITGDIIGAPKPKEQNSADVRKAKNSFRWSGSSGEEASDGFDLNKLKNGFDMKLSDANSSQSRSSSAESNSEDILEAPKTKRLKKNSASKEAQKLEKEMAKAAKLKEREQKKVEKENQKQLKNALRVVENSVKPDQCIQFMIVNIDENLSNQSYGEVIKAGLKNGGYNYKVSKQLVPKLISWTRKVPTIENMLLQNVFQNEKHYLLVMEIAEFLNHIDKNTLTGHIQSLLSMPEIQHLSIAILGLQRYYKYLKQEKNREFKDAVAQSNITNKNTSIEFKDMPKVSKREIDEQLIELQFFCKNIYIRPVEKYEDLAAFVGECTKSVAQIPYKIAKAQPLQEESEFFTVNNRDCVRVDKDGNGLGRLWNQFLTMFPLANLEKAEAVTSVYPTIHSLMEAYKNCQNPEDAEKLLQELPVRRAVGPLGGQRRIGPEFSKKVYKFFCSEENVLL